MTDVEPDAPSAAQQPVGIVIVAAGSSTRFGSDKLAAGISGRSVLQHAVSCMRDALPGARSVLVVRQDAVGEQAGVWSPDGVGVVAGGTRRQDSVANGIAALGLDEGVVVIHDGARPFVPAGDVTALVAAAREHGAACLVAPISDTVKRVSADFVEVTVERRGLARALTPQAFSVAVLRAAWARAGDEDWTDEAGMVEAAGQRVAAVRGDPRNVKVTRPGDLALVRAAVGGSVRIGQGVDVHPFAEGRRLVLCGVDIPEGPGLAGHSDADAALHAVTDAILGACGEGDIGVHFPPSEERWRGAPSAVFVRHAVDLAAARGLRVTGCDVTILAERPRIGPHREAMRARLAELLGVGLDRANVKATTTEALGFVGREEGLVALAVVTLDA